MSARGLLAAVSGISSNWINPRYMTGDHKVERARARLRDRHLFDDHLLRDIGFHEEVSRFHRNRFPGF